jgi:beta-glucosidase
MSTPVRFPKGFVWGCATSAYQIEGGANEDGRGESIWDRYSKTEPHRIKDGSNGDVACDHYHLWPEDIALMTKLGMEAYRFSIAWPRILPQGRLVGGVNARGLDFYSRLVDGLLAQGITPYVTLYHWDLPQVLQNEGGWANRATAEAFVEYADVVSRHLGDRVKYWITHNEPWCSGLLSHQKGAHAPGLRDWPVALAACHHLLLSHGWSVPIVRRNCRVPDRRPEVGITLNLSPTMPASPSADDADACRFHDGWMNRWFLDPLFRGTYPADMVRDYTALGYLSKAGMSFVHPDDLRQIAVQTDFIGINYYHRVVTRSDKVAEKDNLPRTIPLAEPSGCTDIGWEVYADGMFEVLMRVHLEYRPSKILITENGAAYSVGPDAAGRVADEKRVRYFRDHLVAAQRAIQAGAPVQGYFAWSLLDNYEWEQGYTQRFGITWVDYANQKRIPKDSALFLRQVIKENAVSAE